MKLNTHEQQLHIMTKTEGQLNSINNIINC